MSCGDMYDSYERYVRLLEKIEIAYGKDARRLLEEQKDYSHQLGYVQGYRRAMSDYGREDDTP